MYIGTQLMAVGAGASGLKEYFTPWFPKQADNGVFTYEQIQFSGTTFAVTVYTKNREDIGSQGTAFTGFTQIGTTGFFHLQCTGLLELVRFKLSLTPAATGDGVVYRILSPTWYAKAV